jgi:hypothetical protein
MNLLESHMAEWIIFAVTGINVCSPLFKTPFTTVMLNGFLSLMKGLSSTNWSPFPSFFFGLGVTKMLPSPAALFERGTMILRMTVVPPASSLLFKSMKHCSQGSSSRVNNENTENKWNTALKGAALVSKMRTPAITLWFLEHRSNENFYLGFFNKE